MFKALWFMVKVGLLVALVVWVAERPGFVKVEWLDYTFTVHVGLFLLAFLATILLSIFIYRVIQTFVDFPESWRRYATQKRREKGYRALTLGLTAVAAGDTKIAVYQAYRATKFLPQDKGLPLLLEAQAARLDGREEDARKSFMELLESKDAAFLGVRGLLQAALDMGQYPKALELARQALKIHPKQGWILRSVYDLEIRLREWEAARKTLSRAEKAGAIAPEKATSDRIAMLLAEVDILSKAGQHKEALKKAQKAAEYDGSFTPAVSRLARLYNMTGKRRKAIAVIEKAWKATPHPELAAFWEVLRPVGQGRRSPGRMNWIERLLKINSNNVAGQMEAGRIAMEEGLWGEARHHFLRAESIRPGAKLYRQLSELEERTGKNDQSAVLWLEKAADALPEPVWTCMETGRVYDQWYPIAEPHGAFNTIRWDIPQNTFTALPALNEAVLEAPRG